MGFFYGHLIDQESRRKKVVRFTRIVVEEIAKSEPGCRGGGGEGK